MALRRNPAALALARIARSVRAAALPRQQLTASSSLAILGLLGLASARCLLLPSGAPPGPPAPPPAEEVFQVDLNRGDRVELTLLPGIGPVTAERIIAFRECCGPFDCPERLLDVHGIGPKTLERIRPFLRTEPRPQAGAP